MKNLTKLLVLYEEINDYIDTIEEDYVVLSENNNKDLHLLNHIRKLFPALSPLEVSSLLFLIKMGRENHKNSENKVEIVGTYPSDLDVNLRQTVSVVRQLILEAEKSILITGYSISEFINEIIELLINRSRQGVKVQFFIDKGINARAFFNRDINSTNFKIYQYRRNENFSSLHAKVIMADNKRAFVSSSNLSYNGIVNNIEIGTLISGEKVNSIAELFEKLLLKDMFVKIT
ncbi:phospholipase D-like domain-containing protein [Halobacillus salinarum]|uniref:Phospholipase D-like domain-containing protein n=1 Tax=Halobacillus salinarum TaxID=2932257 RepID=A0ABY4EHW5_9BACI|nr:phospholipase D-like domain-containing protein [Halobacillus salinarum]UOQ44063.1 phospholipase D-like domain-containing protein [Halobacillus salinarum]